MYVRDAMVYPQLDNLELPAQSAQEYPLKSSAVIIDPPLDGWSVLFHSALRKYYRIGAREASFFESLDGISTKAELIKRNEAVFSRSQVDSLLLWFDAQGLLSNGQARDLSPAWTFASVFRLLRSPSSARFTLFSPNAFLERHKRSVSELFTGRAYLFYIVLIASPAVLSIFFPSMAHGAFLSSHKISGRSLGILYLMLFLMNIIHELAHAAACKRYGGDVGNIGIMLMFFTPLMYCDVSSTWRFTNTRHKLVVTLAGIGAQMVVGGVVCAAWLVTRSAVLYQFALINFVLALFNLFPFIKLDGYWLLVHMLGEPHLARDGLRSVKLLVRETFGIESSSSSIRRSHVLAYGAAYAFVMPLFWVMGLMGIYRLVFRVSPLGASAIVTAIGLPMLVTSARKGLSLFAPQQMASSSKTSRLSES